MTTGDLLGDARQAMIFRLAGGSDEQSDFVTERILGAVQGRKRDEITSLNDDILTRLLSSVRPETRRVVERHHASGRDTYIVSASPVELVAPLAHALGMTGAIATEAEVAGGVYTGRLTSAFCYGPGKVERVREVAARHGYDLRLSYAYSDSSSDLPLLEIVGHPVAVNPDRNLARVARDRNWPTVTFAQRAKVTATAAGVSGAGLGLAAATYFIGRKHGAASAARLLAQ